MTTPELPRIEEIGWCFSVSPPRRCAVGDLPYPLVVKGPRPEGEQSADLKSWECKTTLYGHHGSEGWKVERYFGRPKEEGLGPFANRRALISLWDETEGKVVRRAMAKSSHFLARHGFDNANISMSMEEKEEIDKVLKRAPEWERDYSGF